MDPFGQQSIDADTREGLHALSAERAEAGGEAWEMIAEGRYQPRRIRGSCLGRVLGLTFALPPGSCGSSRRTS